MFNGSNILNSNNIKIITGNSNPDFVKDIASLLGVTPLKASVSKFSDGEINVKIEDNVRGENIFIIQSLCYPTNDSIMELLIIADALKRSSVRSINAIIPYFGYARQDRKADSRVPISAKLLASMIEISGISRVVTLDLHAAQIQGFFNIPVDNLYGSIIFRQFFKNIDLKNSIVSSADVGGVARSRYFASKLGLDLAIIDKRREMANQAEVMNIIGDVKDKDVIIIDDMIDTGGTLVKGARALKNSGAKSVIACCTHPVLSGTAYDNLNDNAIDKLLVTDSIPLRGSSDKIEVISAAELFANSIQRISENRSISELFLSN